MKRGALRLAVLAVALLGTCGIALAWPSGEARPGMADVPTLLGLSATDVSRVAVSVGERQVVLVRTPYGTWTTPSGELSPSAAMMPNLEDRLFPLKAYRRLAVRHSRPEFGLGEPEIVVSVEGHRGQGRTVIFGSPSFTGGGFYAALGRDEHFVYLVPRQVMDALRSLLEGRTVEALIPPALAKLADRTSGTSGGDGAEPVPMTPWLQQALETGADVPEGIE